MLSRYGSHGTEISIENPPRDPGQPVLSTQHPALSTRHSSLSTRHAWLFAAIWLAAALGGLLLASQPAHPLADVTHYKLWARLVTTEGIAAMYSGEYPDSYVIY